MICCSAYPTLMMRTLSVLDFIFMMILSTRCLTLFTRYSLHENGGVCSYFISQVCTKLESTGVPIDFSLIVYNIQFTTSKHNFWFVTSSYSSNFQKYLAYASLHASQEHQSNYCLIQCMILFLLQASRNIFFRSFSFYENNIWHSKYTTRNPLIYDDLRMTIQILVTK